MFPQEIIRKKRNKQKLTAEEIKFFVETGWIKMKQLL